MQLELRETQTRQLIEDIKSGALDAAMLALPVAEPDIDTIALFEDLFLLAVPASDPRQETARVAAEDIDQSRLILLEDGHCLRDQALAFCATATRGRSSAGGTVFGASSLNTVMQMVAGGYGVTLIPQIAADVERRDARVKFLRLENPQPGRSIGLVFRRTSPRKADFAALGEVVKESVDVAAVKIASQAGLASCASDRDPSNPLFPKRKMDCFSRCCCLAMTSDEELRSDQTPSVPALAAA